MANWSEWILIASAEEAYLDQIDDDDAACYELGIFDEEDDSIKPVYVGETGNLLQRIKSYAETGSHLCEIIDEHLEEGFHLYVRYQLFYSKEDAQTYEAKRLRKFNYDWNIKGNLDEEE